MAIRFRVSGALVALLLALQYAAHGQQGPCSGHVCFGIDWADPSLEDVLSLDVSAYQDGPITPLHYAARNCVTPSVMVALINKGEDVNRPDASTGLTPLQTATIVCRSETVDALLELGADPTVTTKDGSSVLLMAIRRKRPDNTIQLLMRSGVDLDRSNSKGQMPLLTLLAQGRNDLALQLIDAGANPDVVDDNQTTAAHFAAHEADLALMRKLVSYRADFEAQNTQGQTPMHFAANKGMTPEMAALFALANADPNAVDDQGLTPLHYAASRKSGSEVAALLVLKADPNHEDAVGDTPLHYAIEYNGDSQALLALLRLGADPNLPNSKGKRPLFMLVDSQDASNKFEILLGFGADIEATESGGVSLLHRAVRSGNAELAAFLLDVGADAEREDVLGVSPLDIFEKQGIDEPAHSRFLVLQHNREVLRQQIRARTQQRREARKQERDQARAERDQRKAERDQQEEQQQQEPSLLEELGKLLPGAPSADGADAPSGDQRDLEQQLDTIQNVERTIRELLRQIQSDAEQRADQ